MARVLCGCWYVVPGPNPYAIQRRYLPQVDLSSHTTVLATTSRTVLTQKFINSADKALDEVQYTFPLYDGVSVVGFKCTVASRTIVGVVKEKQQARAEYKEALDRGETAGLLEQLPEAADVFTTRIGNVPASEPITVEIVYLGELKHDAETDGVRFTIPTVIAPRYGQVAGDHSDLSKKSLPAIDKGGIRIMVDVVVDEGSAIRGLQSPSHPIAVSMGRTSSTPEHDSDSFSNHLASATLTLGSAELEKDFIIVVLAKGQDTPRAMLEQHPSIRGQRALMATLVPKFNLPAIHPEIVFVVDRSGSMDGKIDTLVAALRIFLKSLPVGVKFNICSFGSNYTFLWPKSKTYDQSSLQTALDHLKTFSANYGGTEMLKPIQATVENRYKDMPLEVMVITDGEIWNQQSLFDFINKARAKNDARFFSLGIGAGASSSLVEGIARAGDGFAQFVGENEKMDKRVVRMLKGALTPHVHDYTLEVKYEKEDDEYEMVESVTDCLKGLVTDTPDSKSPSLKKRVISLFDKSASEEDTAPPAGRYDHLPVVTIPKLLQAPHRIPTLYPFNRTTVYLLISADSCQRTPRAVVLRATSDHGPLELEIPVQDVGVGETIHQLAAKKAIHELEEGRGWITVARDASGKLVKEKHEGRWDEMVEREAVRLGVEFQVGGKWCSFVAVEANSKTGESNESVMEREKSFVSQDSSEGTLFGASSQMLAGAASFGVSASASKFSGPSQTTSFASTQPSLFGSTQGCHESKVGFALSKPAAAGGLFGNANTSSGSGFVGQPKVSPNVQGSDRVTASFGTSANSANAPYYHANTLVGTPASFNASAGLFGAFSGLPSGGLFGSSPASLSKNNADVDSAVEKSKKRMAMPHAAFSASSLFRSSAPKDARSQYQSTAMTAAPPPPPAPGASFSDSTAYVAPAQRHALSAMPRQRQSAVQQQQQARGGGGMRFGASAAAPRRKSAGRRDSSAEADKAEVVDYSDDEMDSRDLQSATGAAQPKLKPQTIEDRVHALIALQEYDGSWAWGTKLLTVLGVDEAKLRAICTSVGVVDDGKVQATIAAVAFLKAKAKAEEEVWEMVVEKAMGWLNGKANEEQVEKVEEGISRE
jgi:hypothetical protein